MVSFIRLKLGFLINTSEPFYRGGYERRTWSMARELVRQGHEVRIYTSCPRDETIEGVRFIPLAPIRTYFNARGVRNGWADVLFTLGIASLFRRLRTRELDAIDICATPFIHLPLAALLFRSKEIPALLTCHEALLSSLPSYARERGHHQPGTVNLIVQVLSGIYRLGMGLFPQRIAVSERTAAALKEEGYPAFRTIEFGLEPEAFRTTAPTAPPPNQPRRLVICGRLTPIKSVDLALQALLSNFGGTTSRSSADALERIPPEQPKPERASGDATQEIKTESSRPNRIEYPFHFDIIGEGSERARLEEMTRAAGATGMVTFHGEVSEVRKRELLAQSEIFILSSPREGFCIAALEAMAQGCTVLMASDPNNPSGALDFVRHDANGIVVRPGAENLRAGLVRLMSEGEEILRLRQAAWLRAQDYRIETQARLLAETYLICRT